MSSKVAPATKVGLFAAGNSKSMGLSMWGVSHRAKTYEDDLGGTRLLRDHDTGCFNLRHPCFLCSSIKTLMFSEVSRLVWWADRGRFVMHDVRSSDTTKTPMSTIRLTVVCVTASSVNGVELVWTGHSGGELCVWNERGQLIAKPCKVSKSPIRVICIANEHSAWVGGDSGNIRIIRLDTQNTPAELTVQTTVVPGLVPVGRITSSNQWRRPPAVMTRPNAIERVPEDQELQSGGSETGGRVWTAAGRVFPFGTIKMWDESDKSLIGKFLCESRGPCTCIKSSPWGAAPPRNLARDMETKDDWRLLTGHESGKILVWDPSLLHMQPMLEIEFRKSPIRSFSVFASLGLLCTCHGDGSVEVARLPTPQIRIPNMSGSQPVIADDQIYPFVPRTISECLHPSGLRYSVGGNDCLITLSNSGRILYWPKEKLEASLKILRQSSLRLPVEAVNESVMVVEYDDIIEGECIWEGDFATVKKGKFLAKDVIIKVANENADSSKAMKAIVKDAHILATLRHPNIVNIMAVGMSPPFVIMQYYEEGSLYDVLKRARNHPRIAKRLSWERRLDIAIGVACGMHFLNAQKIPILHRDLKSPNIFVEKDFVSACVGDFNLSKDTPATMQNAVSSCKPTNPMWLAPEIVSGSSDFSVAADIYSFGMCMWELYTGLTPWEHLKTPGKQVSKEAFYGRIRFELFEKRRPRVQRDETGVLVESPVGRFPQAELLVELIDDCMKEKPQDRPGNFGKIVERLESIKRQYIEARIKHNQAVQMRRNAPAEQVHNPPKTPQSTAPKDPVKDVPLVVHKEMQQPKENFPTATPNAVVTDIPHSPFEIQEPSQGPADEPARVPPTIAASPFNLPSEDTAKIDEEYQLPIGSSSLLPFKPRQEPQIPSPIPPSPFDLPDIDDPGPLAPQSDEPIKKGNLGVDNAKPRHFMPPEVPRSPFGDPIDENG